MIVFALLACDRPVDIVDGTFKYTEAFSNDVDTASPADETEESYEFLEGLTLVIEIPSYTLSLNGDELGSGELVLRDEADWALGCPTNFSAEELMTYNMGAFDVGELSYSTPVVAPTCNGGDVIYLSEYSDSDYDNIGCFTGTCLRFSLE